MLPQNLHRTILLGLFQLLVLARDARCSVVCEMRQSNLCLCLLLFFCLYVSSLLVRTSVLLDQGPTLPQYDFLTSGIYNDPISE